MEQNMKKSAVKEKLSMIDEPLRINLVKNCILAGLLFVIGVLTAVLPYLLLYMLHFISIRD